MLTVLRALDGSLQVACDWWLVDAQGIWNPQGRYVWVNQLELTPGGESRVLIRQVTDEIARRVPWAVAAYWERRDKVKRAPRTYLRETLVRHTAMSRWVHLPTREEVSV